MQVSKIQMPKELAKEEWKKYNDLLKKKKDAYLKNMKRAMFELSKGNELLDIYKVMEEVGIDKFSRPKLAIARADWKTVYFVKKDEGRGFFCGQDNRSWPHNPSGDIDLQPKTFMQWPRVKDEITMSDKSTRMADRRWDIADPTLKTKVPIIPSILMPDGDLKNYYILWEVKEWETVPVKDDPILLKRITENLFVILGAWDVTDLEQSIIRGRYDK